jgi:hypothetical protein
LCLRVLLLFWATGHFRQGYIAGAGCRDLCFSVVSLVASPACRAPYGEGPGERLGVSRHNRPCMACAGFTGVYIMSPIVDGVPLRIDTAVVIAHLQCRMHDAVNGSDFRKVREWKEGRLHDCPDKASWLMQEPQRERHAHANKTKLKTQNETKRKAQNKA